MENLSMSGETEQADYEIMHIDLEDVNDLDKGI
jgi:hypothetical protein